MLLTVLFIVAILFAIPTGGVSVLLFLIVFFARAWWVAQARMQHADSLRSDRQSKSHIKTTQPSYENPRRVPSWAGDRGKALLFIENIQKFSSDRGVPTAFLQATISNSFESLVHHAAMLEQKGASFEHQQMGVSDKLVEMWHVHGSSHAEGLEENIFAEDDGKIGLPSWANDEDMQRDFAAGVQLMSARDGLTPSALNTMFTLEQPLNQALAIAGAVERQGGSFKDQQFAVKKFMVGWWNDLPSDLQESFSQQFG